MNDRVGRIADRCAEGAVADSEDDLNLYAYVGNDPGNKTDPTGEFGFAGAIIGGGLEVLRQVVTGEINDTSFTGIARNVANVAISAGAGAAGAGLGAKIGQLSVGVIAKTGLAAGGGAVIGGASGAASSAVNNNGNVQTSDVVAGAGFGAAGSGLGQLAGSGLSAAGNAIANSQANKLTAAQRSLLGTIRSDTASAGGNIQPAAVTVGNALGNTASNIAGNSGGLAAEAAKSSTCGSRDKSGPGC